MIGLLGKKIGMTQLFSGEGKVVPATVIEGGPCVVVQVKNKEKEGYAAVQLGYGKGKRNLNRPMRGHFKKCNAEPARCLREFHMADPSAFQVGQQITVEQFKVGDYVDIAGLTKGKGFQGGVKRWGWAGGGAAHGSMQHREVGSIGSNTYPGRVFRGHHFPGHMGHVRRTVQNLEIVHVDVTQNLLVVKGSVSGATNGILEIRPAVKNPAAHKKVHVEAAKHKEKSAKGGSASSGKETKK
ncbi:MAG: 50S ribosomal protein L3 [Candidatus Omnitrophica bacterium]|nr:50S ribosomal protein L3 [Candidatus Omnitrophota bacterium]